ncbi:MAG: GTP-binding protein [Lachnospiraceae bacterium]|nr:GTP-binding protein [Lachnospiraceae bacterium]
MTKIDIFSGFLGAGKTTLIKKLLKEALADTKVVLIENEFGEIGIDGGFLKEAGIEIKEMNSGCICCSLVGDFGTSLKEVLTTYTPERVLIEPSGVGKLSDVIRAVENVAADIEVEVNSAVAVVDAGKCKMYIKNFGEFFCNQIAYAGTIILSRTAGMSQDKLETCISMLREYNKEATIITTPWEELQGTDILKTIEGADKLEDMIKELMEQAHDHEHEHHHHEHGEDCTCGCHDHHHEHHHHDDHDHEHHHHGDHDHEHHHDEHDHHHDHGHHHEHGEDCTCGCHDHDHHHHHHHADEVFSSWGKETPAVYTEEEISGLLDALESGDYGMILRAKGMVAASEGEWIYFDYVPGESDIRRGKPQVTGKLCVIGAELNEDKLEALFGRN